MIEKEAGWSELFRAGGIAVPLFAGGIALQAMETFISASMLPTVVAEIGGVAFFAWNTSLFIVASILGTVFMALRPAGIGPRGAYLVAAAVFALGSLVAGLSGTMAVLLAGRTLQGFGAGLLVATTFSMLRIVFPESLWPRAMALNAVVWGVATVLGPAIGGVFAEYGIWRWAFLGIPPLAGLLALGALRVLPASPRERNREAAPLPQTIPLVGAVVAVSVAGVMTERVGVAVVLLAGATVALVLVGWIERRSDVRLLPAGSFSLAAPVGRMFAATLLIGVSITSDIFAPLYLQRLHALSPLWAGYVAALVAAGWTVAALITAGWTGRRVHAAIVAAPVIILASTAAMFLWLGSGEGGVTGLAVSAAALFAMGAGIGGTFQHLSTGILGSVGEAEGNRAAAAIAMIQLFAAGLGAALAGLAVNAAGLPGADTVPQVEHSARVLYLVFALIAAAAIPLSILAGRSAARR